MKQIDNIDSSQRRKPIQPSLRFHEENLRLFDRTLTEITQNRSRSRFGWNGQRLTLIVSRPRGFVLEKITSSRWLVVKQPG